jgi:hypothetical protein
MVTMCTVGLCAQCLCAVYTCSTALRVTTVACLMHYGRCITMVYYSLVLQIGKMSFIGRHLHLLYQLSWLLQLTVLKTYITSLTSVRRCHLVWHRLSLPRSSSSSERRFSGSEFWTVSRLEPHSRRPHSGTITFFPAFVICLIFRPYLFSWYSLATELPSLLPSVSIMLNLSGLAKQARERTETLSSRLVSFASPSPGLRLPAPSPSRSTADGSLFGAEGDDTGELTSALATSRLSGGLPASMT